MTVLYVVSYIATTKLDCLVTPVIFFFFPVKFCVSSHIDRE